MSWLQRLGLVYRTLKYNVKTRLGLALSIDEAYERVGDFILLTAQIFHSQDLHDYENDVYAIGRQWADSNGGGRYYPTKEATFAALRAINDVVSRARLVDD